MATISNLGFEIAGVAPGDAQGWFVRAVVSDFLFAVFAGASVPSATETFEAGWGNAVDPFDTEFAAFTIIAGAQDFESFEEGWSSNEQSVVDVDSLAVEFAVFDGAAGTAEGFEEGWSSNENSIPQLGGGDVTEAAFGVNFLFPFEGFDSEWAGLEGPLERVEFFDISQSLTFADAGVFDTVSGAGDFVAEGVRSGSSIRVTPGSLLNSGAFTVRDVAPTAITLSSADALVNEGPVAATIDNQEPALFDGMENETFEFAWTAISGGL